MYAIIFPRKHLALSELVLLKYLSLKWLQCTISDLLEYFIKTVPIFLWTIEMEILLLTGQAFIQFVNDFL